MASMGSPGALGGGCLTCRVSRLCGARDGPAASGVPCFGPAVRLNHAIGGLDWILKAFHHRRP